MSQEIRIDKSHEDKGLRGKADLIAYNETLRRIDGLEKRIAEFRETMYDPNTPTLSDMPITHNTTGISRQERLVARLGDMQGRLGDLVKIEQQQYDKIIPALQKLDPDEDLLLSLRYIDRRSWAAVAEELYGYEEDFDVFFDRYQKRAFRAHAQALQHLEKVYDEIYPVISKISNTGSTEDEGR